MSFIRIIYFLMHWNFRNYDLELTQYRDFCNKEFVVEVMKSVDEQIFYLKKLFNDFWKEKSNERLHVKGLISFSSFAPKIVRDRKLRKCKTLQWVYLKFLFMWSSLIDAISRNEIIFKIKVWNTNTPNQNLYLRINCHATEKLSAEQIDEKLTFHKRFIKYSSIQFLFVLSINFQ